MFEIIYYHILRLSVKYSRVEVELKQTGSAAIFSVQLASHVEATISCGFGKKSPAAGRLHF